MRAEFVPVSCAGVLISYYVATNTAFLTSRFHIITKHSLSLFFKFLIQDTKIASLERNIRDLEDEIQMLKTNGVLNIEDREEEIKQIEVYKSHSKFMKNKVQSTNKIV